MGQLLSNEKDHSNNQDEIYADKHNNAAQEFQEKKDVGLDERIKAHLEAKTGLPVATNKDMTITVGPQSEDGIRGVAPLYKEYDKDGLTFGGRKKTKKTKKTKKFKKTKKEKTKRKSV